MITNIKLYKKLNEEFNPKKIKSSKDVPCIMFTDIVGSSKLWEEDSKNMSVRLDKLFNSIQNITSKYKNSFIVKTIGDAFMIYFESDESLKDAISCAIAIHDLEQFEMRIGMCYGNVIIKEYKIQNKNFMDFFGNVVNVASRMESKVSEAKGFAFTTVDDLEDSESEAILTFLEKSNHKIEKIKYGDDCKQYNEDRQKRSARLLTDLQINHCKDVDELKGVQELIAYKVKI